jgi:hypothetical protein
MKKKIEMKSRTILIFIILMGVILLYSNSIKEKDSNLGIFHFSETRPGIDYQSPEKLCSMDLSGNWITSDGFITSIWVPVLGCYRTQPNYPWWKLWGIYRSTSIYVTTH